MSFQILQATQTWTLHKESGQWMRECIARRSDGALRLILVRDDLVPAHLLAPVQ